MGTAAAIPVRTPAALGDRSFLCFSRWVATTMMATDTETRPMMATTMTVAVEAGAAMAAGPMVTATIAMGITVAAIATTAGMAVMAIACFPEVRGTVWAVEESANGYEFEGSGYTKLPASDVSFS